MPNEFYIILSGEVGIYPPRLDELITKEGKIIEKLKFSMGKTGENLTMEFADISLYADWNKMDPEEKEFCHNIRKFEDGKVSFKSTYLEKKLGALPEEILRAPEFYHHVILVCLTLRMDC